MDSAVGFANTYICLIVIYLVDSAIQCLNNQGLIALFSFWVIGPGCHQLLVSFPFWKRTEFIIHQDLWLPAVLGFLLSRYPIKCWTNRFVWDSSWGCGGASESCCRNFYGNRGNIFCGNDLSFDYRINKCSTQKKKKIFGLVSCLIAILNRLNSIIWLWDQ